jgi:hypothetical protein
MRHDFAAARLGSTLFLLLTLVQPSPAVIPPPERLLPENTLVLLTAPDFTKLRAAWDKLPQKRFLDDPAMKPFRDNFVAKWKEQFVKPLERELEIKTEDYTGLLQGQVTLALTEESDEPEAKSAGMLLLIDAKDKSNQLKKNLSALRKKWVDGGKALKSTKIRDNEFTILTVSSNDLPKTLRKFFPKGSEVQELGDENASKPEPQNDELIIGQVDSLLVLSTSVKAVEKVVARATGGAIPPLADVATYQADHAALFRDAPLYGWINLKVFIDNLTRKLAQHKENDEAPNPFDVKPQKVLASLGLSGLKTLAFCYQPTRDGSMVQLFLGVPESTRQGLFRILAGEPRDSRPPAFVPADVVKFQRWRIDGQKAWETAQKSIADISPQWLNGINFLLETANTAAKEKDPGFDVKKNLIANLGDDLISYEKAPADKSPAPLNSPPSLFLLASPNAEVFAASLKSILVFAQQSGGAPDEREFLGRKIYSVSLKSVMVPLGGGEGAAAAPRSVTYAASGGYVAFSSEPALVEEYLRSSEGQRKALRDAPGLTEAAQRVLGPNSSLFGYENQVETMRAMFERLRKNGAASSAGSSGAAANLLQSGVNVPATVQGFKELMDFSLLPNFDAIAKYFGLVVYGGGATVDGLSLKFFLPSPAAANAQ